MGIWKPIYLIGGDASFVIDEIIWKAVLNEIKWDVEVSLVFGNLDEGQVGMTGLINVTIEGIGSYTQCE